MIIKNITPNDTLLLKGLAILVIMLHNFFHILPSAPGENEISFDTAHVLNLWHNLSTSPQDSVKQLFSFFGHYAVQVFVFLSGYGLAVKYADGIKNNFYAFIKSRILKLYPALFFGIVFLFLYKVVVVLLASRKEIDLYTFVQEAALKLTLLSNLIPGQALTISGPWWFFSVLFQLYLLAPVLLKIRSTWWLWALIGVAWLVQLASLSWSPELLAYLRLNVIGHLPEFCLGIILARKGVFKLPVWGYVILLAVFLAGAFNPVLWIFSFFTIPFLILPLTRLEFDVSWLGKGIYFFGKNSLYFFVVHALCRAPFVAFASQSAWHAVAASIMYLGLVTLLTLAFRFMVAYLTRPLLRFKLAA